MDKKSSIVILGAGPCGLAAAWALTEQGFSNVTVLEKNSRVGGMVRSEIINGNAYEHGAHYFHSDDKEIIDKVLALLGNDYVSNKRNLMIKFNGKYFQYPLKVNDLISGFKFHELILFFSSMVYAWVKNKIFPRALLTAEDVLMAKYGRRLYRSFFEGYIVNFWAMHPSGLSAVFAERRISRLDAMDLLRKILSIFKVTGSSNKQDEFIEVVRGYLYYPYRGMSEIWNRIAGKIEKNGGRILTDVKIKSIINSKNKTGMIESVCFENNGAEKIIHSDAVISSIPIASFLNSLAAVDKDIRNIAGKLRYRSLITIGLLVARDKILPSYCTYYHNRIFSRISEPKQAGLEVNPPDHSVLLVEMSCDVNDAIWDNPESVIDNVYGELEDEGLLRRGEIKEVHIQKEQHAYPVFDLDYEDKIKKIRFYFSGLKNVYSSGRQGLFQYINAHVAIRMGFTISEMIMQGKPKNNSSNNTIYF